MLAIQTTIALYFKSIQGCKTANRKHTVTLVASQMLLHTMLQHS